MAAIVGSSVSVTTAATALNTAATDGCTLFIQNGATAIAVGGSTVTATTGPLIAATTGTLTIQLKPGQVLYGITAASTSTVLVLQT